MFSRRGVRCCKCRFWSFCSAYSLATSSKPESRWLDSSRSSSQSLMTLSKPAVKTVWSGRVVQQYTQFSWPSSTNLVVPDDKSHTLIELSREPLKAYSPPTIMEQQKMPFLWPSSFRRISPVSTHHTSRLRSRPPLIARLPSFQTSQQYTDLV